MKYFWCGVIGMVMMMTACGHHDANGTDSAISNLALHSHLANQVAAEPVANVVPDPSYPNSPYSLVKAGLASGDRAQSIVDSLLRPNAMIDLSQAAYDAADQEGQILQRQGGSIHDRIALSTLRVGSLRLSWDPEVLLSEGYFPRRSPNADGSIPVRQTLTINLEGRVVTYPDEHGLPFCVVFVGPFYKREALPEDPAHAVRVVEHRIGCP